MKIQTFSLAGFLLCISFFLTGALADDGKCVVREGMEIHAHMCKGQNAMMCRTHSGFCAWKSGEEPVRVVIEKKEKKCVAKEGLAAQTQFCRSLSLELCEQHSGVCELR